MSGSKGCNVFQRVNRTGEKCHTNSWRWKDPEKSKSSRESSTKNCAERQPRVCGQVVKAFRGSLRDPSSNPHHTRFPQRVATGAFTFSLGNDLPHKAERLLNS
ncbi:hypothetical protein YC2023_012915 [Brassica napus]